MEKKLIDFTKVKIANIDGSKEEMDVSKVVSNCIYSQTPDIGMMKLSVEIYDNGKAEMDEVAIMYFREVLSKTNTIIAALKVALQDIFDNALKSKPGENEKA